MFVQLIIFLYHTIFSEIIKSALNGGFLAYANMNRMHHHDFEKKIGQIFKDLEDKFEEETDDRRVKLRNAMVFEANIRLMRHPYDLIGTRRFKLFEDSLKNFLTNEGRDEPIETWHHNLKEKMSRCFKLNDGGTKYRIFKVMKIVTVVALVTLVVNGNDYMQDIKVIETFWRIAYKGHTLEEENTNKYQAILLLKFYPPAMFLSVVSIFSMVQIIFHLPSLWYRFKVSMQMESAICELGQENIDPSHVVNQYNLPISESRNEAIWQMMVQWGQYYCLAWYVTWRLQISEVDKATDEFDDVNDLLNFYRLCPSLIFQCLFINLWSVCNSQHYLQVQNIWKTKVTLHVVLCYDYNMQHVHTVGMADRYQRSQYWIPRRL